MTAPSRRSRPRSKQSSSAGAQRDDSASQTPSRVKVTRSTSPFSTAPSSPESSRRSLPINSTPSNTKIPNSFGDSGSRNSPGTGVVTRKSLETPPGPKFKPNSDEMAGMDPDTIQVAYHRSSHSLSKIQAAESNGSPTMSSKTISNGETLPARMPSPPVAIDNIGIKDDGSSSLSDIEDGIDEDDRQDHNGAPSDPVAENESEAETERLDISPQRLRQRRNVVLSSAESVQSIERSPSKLLTETVHADADVTYPATPGFDSLQDVEMDQEEVTEDAAIAEKTEEDNLSTTGTNKSSGGLDTTTAATSLGDSAGEGPRIPSPPEALGRKRKRTSPRNHSASDEMDTEEPARKRTGSVKDGTITNGTDTPEEHETQVPLAEEYPDTGIRAADGEASHDQPDPEPTEKDDVPIAPSKSSKGKKGKRKEKKSKPTAHSRVDVDKPESADVGDIDETNGEERGNVNNEENVNGEEEPEVEAEEEAETALRYEEELANKKTAMDHLRLIEEQYATFRDKLYGEAIAKVEAEEALLKQFNSTHPLFLAWMQCIDARRDEKVNHENALMMYKIQTQERTTVAKKSQIHSQFFQDVRATRENHSETLGQLWYSIQKDRRGWEGSAPEFMYRFSTRRSQQVAQQTAYNKEVSLLSGIAKFIGFPASPDVLGARPSEIDEDLQSMGIKPLPVRTATHSSSHAPLPRVASTFPSPPSVHRPKVAAVADEQFLQQNPWANPQHPDHLKHYLLSQRQAFSTPLSHSASQQLHQVPQRTGSPLSAPPISRRREFVDVSQQKS